MRFLRGATPCLVALSTLMSFVVQAAPPTEFETASSAPRLITYLDLLAKARRPMEEQRLDGLLAEHRLALQESRGFLREGPTASLQVGPRRNLQGPSSTDTSLDVEMPLFLSSGVRRELEKALGEAHPLLREAARREWALRLRSAYLDAWLAAGLLELRKVDRALVEDWLRVVRTRFEAGAEPEFQVTLVEGERLRVDQELEEARIQAAHTWSALAALSDIPTAPQGLADPEALPALPAGDLHLQEGPLRRALMAQVELEERSLRLKESMSLSRWSLRASHAREGEDRVTRVGVAWRLPRPGEGASLRNHTEAQIRTLRGEARQALAELDARGLSLASRIQTAREVPPAPDLSKAMAALSLRLQEGRERPSEALPIRRQLLLAQMDLLRRTHAQHLLHAELQTLMPAQSTEVAR